MSYTRHYRWDIFVSYCHSDELLVVEGQRHWVSHFVSDLRRVISSVLGAEITIFLHGGEGHSDVPPEQVREAIDESATMVVLSSPAYSRSLSDFADLEAFEARDNLGRLFVVEVLPLGEEETASPLSGHLVWRFWHRSEDTGVPTPLRPSTPDYYQRIWDVADSLGSELRTIKQPDTQTHPSPSAAPPKPRIFLSYSSKDRDRIRPLADRLEQAGHEVWWDPHIDMGSPFRKVIAAQLAKAQIVLVAWSSNSVDSDWVQEEAEEGKRRGCLRPVLIDPVEPPIGFRSYQTLDIRGWDQKTGDAIIARLLEQLSRVPPAAF